MHDDARRYRAVNGHNSSEGGPGYGDSRSHAYNCRGVPLHSRPHAGTGGDRDLAGLCRCRRRGRGNRAADRTVDRGIEYHRHPVSRGAWPRSRYGRVAECPIRPGRRPQPGGPSSRDRAIRRGTGGRRRDLPGRAGPRSGRARGRILARCDRHHPVTSRCAPGHRAVGRRSGAAWPVVSRSAWTDGGCGRTGCVHELLGRRPYHRRSAELDRALGRGGTAHPVPVPHPAGPRRGRNRAGGSGGEAGGRGNPGRRARGHRGVRDRVGACPACPAGERYRRVRHGPHHAGRDRCRDGNGGHSSRKP